jgi:very-short-patch-repair endonuclease
MSRTDYCVTPSSSGATTDHAERGEVLVALLKDRRDFQYLTNEGWYRIPVQSTPRRWPPKWLAFYLPKAFAEQAFAVRYYGRVRDEIEKVPRRALIPEPAHPNADKLYYRIQLEDLKELPQPIPSKRFRRIVFIPTTCRKLFLAQEINDLFDDSPLEDLLWEELKTRQIPAERQWEALIRERLYRLDFALFCNGGNIDVEADGDMWHNPPERVRADKARNNELSSAHWHLLRFNGEEIRERMGPYCIARITELINRLGGLQEETMAPRVFHELPDGSIQQLALFENESPYELD